MGNLDDSELMTLKREMKEYSEEQISLLRCKGVFPYEFMTGFDKLQYPRLPDKSEFYSKLNNTHISDEDYVHAQNVWKTFGFKTMRDYLDLYMKTDVLLLVDMMESFQKQCMDVYKLDPLHYYTAPALSWDTSLKMTNKRLELITDPTMHLFFERGSRGGNECRKDKTRYRE